MTEDNPAKLTEAQRLALVERDARDHSRILTELVQAGRSFTDEQLEQLRTLFRDELADAGLRIDGPEHVDDAREDFRFLRRFRRAWDSAGHKVGNAVLFGIIGIAGSIIGLGFWAWLSSNLNK